MMLVWLAVGCVSWQAAPVDLVERTDVFIGTGGQGFGQGSQHPGAALPGGLMRVGPDTVDESGALGFMHCSGYYYEDPYISAFSHTRKPGIGVPDGGAVGFMPTTSELTDWKDVRAPLDHSLETARPGYYAIELPEIARVEIAAGRRVAHHRIDWFGADRWLTVDLAHTGSTDHGVGDTWIEIDRGAATVRGYVLMDGDLTGRSGGEPTYFVARFSQAWVGDTLWSDGRPQDSGVTRVDGRDIQLTLQFDADIEFRVGVSFVDVGGAALNLDLEHPDGSLEELASRGTQIWRDALGRIEVTGGTAEQQEIFASALYHALLMPTAYGDADGLYLAAGGGIGHQRGWTYYTDFSLWDTYRTLHPLMILAWPDLAADHARSLTDMGERLGYLPRWPAGQGESGSMLGNSADVVLAETWLKGITDWPGERALAISLEQASDLDSVRPRDDLEDVLTYGYVPDDLADSSVSKTLEYAIDDHALSLWAGDLGLTDTETEFQARSMAYQKVFDPDTQFMRGRNSDGSWADFSELSWESAYAEGNAWQYTWLVPHDAEGLAALFGGREALFAKLDRFFEQSTLQEDTYLPDNYYWHGNEPDLHAAYLYALLGRPADTWKWSAWIRDSKYGGSPDGLDGNDDGGTLSSWYAMVAIGLYPMNATTDYVLLPPVFDRVVLHRPDGDLTLIAQGTGENLSGVLVDGVALERAVLNHKDLVGAQTLTFLRSETDEGWGSW
jgi:predicted alpha-1,2-mannosidase